MFICSCSSGYMGLLCDREIDECMSSPCVHGKCRDLVGKFECRCDAGYAGIWCEENVDECLSSPCHHGDCVDEVDGYMCQCDDLYQGGTLYLLYSYINAWGNRLPISDPCTCFFIANKYVSQIKM